MANDNGCVMIDENGRKESKNDDCATDKSQDNKGTNKDQILQGKNQRNVFTDLLNPIPPKSDSIPSDTTTNVDSISVNGNCSKTDKKKPRKAKSNLSNPRVAPEFISGKHGLECARCLSDQFADQAIKCHMCRRTFHASCRTQSGNNSDLAVCAPSYVRNLNSLIDRTNDSSRWGNLLFLCDDCYTIITPIMREKNVTDSTMVGLSNKSSMPQEKEVASIGVNASTIKNDQSTLTDENSVFLCDCKDQQTMELDEIRNGDKNSAAAVNEMLETFKDTVLNDVSVLINDKLKEIMAKDDSLESVYCSKVQRSRTQKLSADSNVTTDSGRTSMSTDSTLSNPSVLCYPDGPNDREEQNRYSRALQSTPNGPVHAVFNVRKTISTPTIAETETKTPSSAPTTPSTTGHIVVLRLDKSKTNMSNAKKEAASALKNVPINVMRENLRDNKIVIFFPTNEHKVKGKQVLTDSFKDTDIEVDNEKKMFPKVTVTNIPSYMTSHISSKGISQADYRKRVNEYLKEKFMEKNENVAKMVNDDGKTFELVYVKSGYNYITVGIKVSPLVRNLLAEQKYLFIGETRCPVVDRLDLKQCFRCQRIGHIATNCREDIICMYCSGSHVTRGCPYKNHKEKYRCRNCSLSENTAYQKDCHTHHSSDNNCPVIQEKLNVIRDRTEYSKNL